MSDTLDELWKEQPVRYCDEDGTFLARGTGVELARRVHELEKRLELAERICREVADRHWHAGKMDPCEFGNAIAEWLDKSQVQP